jgi:2-succinyl-5-enolpyruvyl-6-hydroxy-3-cyclohexene-1-carboxylate synthase
VITADRPAELRDTGAPQTIDQRDLYGTAAALFLDVDAAAPADPGIIAGRLWEAALAPVPAPVHLNVQFAEPLMPAGGALPDVTPTVPDPRLPAREPPEITGLTRLVASRRGMLVCGPQDDPALPAAAAAAAEALGWPILADPLSGLRAGPHDRQRVICSGDLLAGAGWLDRAGPEVAVRVGPIPTSKHVWSWLDDHPEVPLAVVDPVGWADPRGRIACTVRAAPAAALRALADAAPDPAPAQWLTAWTTADAAVRDAAAATLATFDFPTEPAVAGTIARALPDGAIFWVASSMPVRDTDLTFGCMSRAVRVAANRGANGIDGLLSSALGTAATGRHTIALAGDLSVLHDLGALVTAARCWIPLTIVAVNNDGGGIFHFLPQVEGDPELFERHFATPHGLDLAAAARGLGVPSERIADRDALAEAVAAPPEGPRFLEVVTDRGGNVAVHRALRDAAAAAL